MHPCNENAVGLFGLFFCFGSNLTFLLQRELFFIILPLLDIAVRDRKVEYE